MGSFGLATVKMGSGELNFEDYLLAQFTSDNTTSFFEGDCGHFFPPFFPKGRSKSKWAEIDKSTLRFHSVKMKFFKLKVEVDWNRQL